MSYAHTPQPMIITPAPPEEPIEDLYNYRVSVKSKRICCDKCEAFIKVLLGMIYDDNPFTVDYYCRSYINPEFLTEKLSDHLMSLMIRRDIPNFKKVYRFIQTRNINIKYNSGLNIWFLDFVKNNLFEMIHPEMATMKLNSDNIIYLVYGRPSPIHTKLKEVFKDVKLIPDIKKMISEYTSSMWNHISIYRFLSSLSDDNINGIITNMYAGLYNASGMDITDVKINPTLLKMLFIIIKKRNINSIKMNSILRYLTEHTNISHHNISEIIRMHYAMAPQNYQLADTKVFI